jgi:hypothetical protein
MSYDNSLIDPVTKQTIVLTEPHQLRGGTYQMGGTQEAWLNVTYNYSKHFYRVFPARENNGGIRFIYGLTGAESIPILKAAIKQLGDDVDDDYWKACIVRATSVGTIATRWNLGGRLSNERTRFHRHGLHRFTGQGF